MSCEDVSDLIDTGLSPERQQAELSELMVSLKKLAREKGVCCDGSHADSRWLLATLDKAWRNDRRGQLAVRTEPLCMPDSILELSYCEAAADGDREKPVTETVYCFARNNDGDVVLYISDAVFMNEMNIILDKRDEFAAALSQYIDPSLAEQVMENLQERAKEALTFAQANIDYSLRLAEKNELMELQGLVLIAGGDDRHPSQTEEQAEYAPTPLKTLETPGLFNKGTSLAKHALTRLGLLR